MHFVSRRSRISSRNAEPSGSGRCRITADGFGELQPNGRTLSRRRCAIGRVGMWRGGSRFGLSVAAPFVWRCPSTLAVAPFPHPSHRTGRADFPHPALGQDFTPSPTARHAPSARADETHGPVEIRGRIVPIPATPHLVLVAQPPAQPRHRIVVDCPIRLVDGAHLEVVRPSTQRTVQLTNQCRGLLPSIASAVSA